MGRYTASIPSPWGGWWGWGVTLSGTTRYRAPPSLRTVFRFSGFPAASTSSQVEESSSQTETSSSAVESSQAVSESSLSSAEDAETKDITLKVVHGDGTEKEFPITTTAATLGDALVAEGLVEGEESSYGLFITTVDGETVDDANQEWWCLTKGGEMWNYGADATELSDGDTYELTFTVGY